MRAFAVLSIAVIVTGSTMRLAFAADDPGYTPGPWHYKSVTCVDTTVKYVEPRLIEEGQTPKPADFDSGVVVGFNTSLGLAPIFSKDVAEVVHYASVADNAHMQSEKAGDKVQVCFLGGPAPTVGCNPDVDDRGRQYRVWDYARKFQYNGFNAEHLCGGA